MRLAAQLVYRHALWTKETNISNKRNRVKNPNWQEANQLAIYKGWPRIWTRDYWETNPASGRVEALQHQRPKPLGHAASYKL